MGVLKCAWPKAVTVEMKQIITGGCADVKEKTVNYLPLLYSQSIPLGNHEVATVARKNNYHQRFYPIFFEYYTKCFLNIFVLV